VNANRIAQLALLLSGITLIVVLLIAIRPLPAPVAPVPTAPPVDNTAALMAELEDLRVEVATLQQSIVDVQSLVRAVIGQDGSNPGGPVVGTPDQLTQRLERLESSLSAVGAKLDAICRAIESSAFAPSGFACP
jgi:hypothetical protein